MEKEKISGIYKITNLINNKVYIGQSLDIHERWRRHKNSLDGKYHCNKHLEKAWHKYGKENFKFEIIEECNVSKLSENEIRYIKFYDSYKNGYNQTIGGESPSLTPEIREKISKSNIGKKISEETRKKLIESHKGQFVSGKTRKIIGEKSHTNKNKVVQINYDGEIIKIWNSLLDIQKEFLKEEYPSKIRSVRGCLERERYTAYDYIWLYYEDFILNGIDLSIYNNKKNKKSVYQLNENNEIIKYWDSMREVENELGINGYTIGLCCKNKRKTAGGFRWMFVN